MAKSTNKTMMGILFIAFAFLLLFIFFSLKTIRSLDREGKLPGGQTATIGVVEINGIILESRKTIELLLRAEEIESIKAIIVRINSPGGVVGPTQEIYQEIRRINEEKPVYASFGAVAASGGYYIGSAAEKIFANPGTLTGSIGVLMEFINLEKLFAFLKMDLDVIKAGRYKDIGSSDRKMTREERKLMQKVLDGVHRQFISDILHTRKDRIKGDLAKHAQGQIFNGEEAHRLGLVDELLGLHQAGRKIHQELQLEGEFGLRYFRKKEKISIEDLFSSVGSHLFGLGKEVFFQFQQFPMLMFLMKAL